MYRRRSIFRLLVLCTLLFGSLSAEGQRRPISREELEQVANPTLAKGSEALHSDQLSYQLGRISEDGGAVEGHFSFENRGQEAIVILRASADCGCLKVDYPTGPILSGQSVKVNFSYNPKGYPGVLNRRILLYTNLSDSAPSAKVSITGYVEASTDVSGRFPFARGAALLKAEGVTFESSGARQVERILAHNNSGNDIYVRALSGSLPRGVTLVTEPERVSPSEEFDIVIAFDPSGWVGEYRGFNIFLDGVGASPRNSVIEINFR